MRPRLLGSIIPTTIFSVEKRFGRRGEELCRGIDTVFITSSGCVWA